MIPRCWHMTFQDNFSFFHNNNDITVSLMQRVDVDLVIHNDVMRLVTSA